MAVKKTDMTLLRKHENGARFVQIRPIGVIRSVLKRRGEAPKFSILDGRTASFQSTYRIFSGTKTDSQLKMDNSFIHTSSCLGRWTKQPGARAKFIG